MPVQIRIMATDAEKICCAPVCLRRETKNIRGQCLKRRGSSRVGEVWALQAQVPTFGTAWVMHRDDATGDPRPCGKA
jgi:hypothetical protein